MSSYKFDFGTHYLLNGREYVVRKKNDNSVEVFNVNYDTVEEWAVENLWETWRSGELVFKKSGNQEDVLPHKLMDLEEMPEHLIQEAFARLDILEPILDGRIKPREIQEYAIQVDVSVATLYRWKKRWEKNHDIRYLVPRRTERGPKAHRTNPEILKLIEQVLDDMAYQGVDANDKDFYSEFLLRLDEKNEYRDDVDKFPEISIATFRRRKREVLDRRRFNRSLFGSHLASLMEDGVQHNVIVTRPLERVEMDSTPTDVLLIDPKTLRAKRGHLVYAIDAFGSMPLGFKLTMGPPTAADIKECLMHCMTPKTYMAKEFPFVENVWAGFGKPKTLVLDNAQVNDSWEMEDVCKSIGIRIQFAKVGAGNQKARIERGFRTLNQKWIHGTSGTTKSNPIERARYDSEGNACISTQKFVQMAHLVITDLVAHDFNRGVGTTPHDKWTQGWKENPHLQNTLSRSFEELQFLLITGHERRQVQSIGIELLGGDFNSPELMQLRSQLIKDKRDKERVTVRFNRADMRMVFVQNPYTHGFITAKAIGLEQKDIDPSLPVPALALEQELAEARKNKNGIDPRARGRVNRKLDEIEAEGKKEKRQAQRKAKEREDTDDDARNSQEWDIPQLNMVNRTWDMPPEADTISGVEEDNTFHSNKRKTNKSSNDPAEDEMMKDDVSFSHDLSDDDLEDMDVSFKN